MKRLTRTLVYEGPDDWINDCFKRRYIKGISSPEYIQLPRIIIETQCVVENLPAHPLPKGDLNDG